MVRSFIKKTTNVGGSTGVIIPKEVLYAEGIKRGMDVRVIIEAIPHQIAEESTEFARTTPNAHKRNRNQNKGQGSDNALQGYPSMVKRARFVLGQKNRSYMVTDYRGVVLLEVVEGSHND